MKITLKTVQGKQVPIEVTETMTVRSIRAIFTFLEHLFTKSTSITILQIAELKEKIAQELSTPADSQKLIAYGKQLEDNNKTLKEYNIKEGDFIVLFVTKVSQDYD